MSDNKTEIVHHPFPGEPIERSESAVTPMELLQLAMTQNADLAKLEKLMELQERWEKNEARKAFVIAMNAFKSNPPQIIKDRHVDYTTKTGFRVVYDHATLGKVCDAITESLSRHGISHRWKVDQSTPSVIRVTCILTHVAGHSEETTLCAGPDDSGGKNPIQAIASAVKYLQRYTVLAATGLESGDGDDDGQGSEGQKMEKLNDFIEAIGKCPNLKALESLFREAYSEAATLKNVTAQKTLIAAKDARKKMLGGNGSAS